MINYQLLPHNGVECSVSCDFINPEMSDINFHAFLSGALISTCRLREVQHQNMVVYDQMEIHPNTLSICIFVIRYQTY